MGDVHVIIFVICGDWGDYPITDATGLLNSLYGAMS